MVMQPFFCSGAFLACYTEHYCPRAANNSERFFYHTKFSAAAEDWGFGGNVRFLFFVLCSSLMIYDPLIFKLTFKKCHVLSTVKAWCLMPLILTLRKAKVLITSFLTDSSRNSPYIYGETSPASRVTKQDSALKEVNTGFTISSAWTGISLWELKQCEKSGSIQVIHPAHRTALE